MLLESLAWLTRRASPLARRMGYLRESIATEARARRCARAWQAHRARCRSLVLEAMREAGASKRALILGAGLTDDIPLGEISEAFEDVLLLDMVFTPQTHHLARRLGNVSCVEHDLSGVAEAVMRANKHALPPKPEPGLPGACAAADFIISINLLSQLPLLPGEWLRAHTDMSEDMLHTWSRMLIEAHVDLLQRQAAAVCLISDIAHIYRDADGRLLEREDRTYAAALPDCETPWRWQLAPLGEIDRRTSLEARVCAWYKPPGAHAFAVWSGEQ